MISKSESLRKVRGFGASLPAARDREDRFGPSVTQATLARACIWFEYRFEVSSNSNYAIEYYVC
jgi:hypothetical protein